MTLVAMFPGQSSRYPEMLSKLATEPACAPILAEAAAILGGALPADFTTNRDVQVGVFLANHLHLKRLEAAGVTTRWSLGLSLGEYNHLVHIGALAFDDALRLVDARGRLYDEATGGLMVSVFPLDAAPIEQAIMRLGLSERVGVGLYNSPRQHVLSGDRAAVEQVLAELETEEYFDATVIEPRIPMHAPCFGATAERFARLLADVRFAEPTGVYVPNVRGALLGRAIATEIRDCLIAHVHRPVRWQASVDAIAAHVAEPWFVEVGPRGVLHNLFGKDWMPGRRAKTDVATFDALVQELRDVR
jgi:[acyl-carrier-protein] S-malonyltransferase